MAVRACETVTSWVVLSAAGSCLLAAQEESCLLHLRSMLLLATECCFNSLSGVLSFPVSCIADADQPQLLGQSTRCAVSAYESYYKTCGRSIFVS